MTGTSRISGTLAIREPQFRVISIQTANQKSTHLRVAAYARVSTSSDDQKNSFEAQNRYYTSMITSKDDWSLVDVYADEGITGTKIDKRDDFKRMIDDCAHGKIDCILVKSISRFARNTAECLKTIRMLKSINVSVQFEKEGIDTGLIAGEMLTSIFASVAQAESESISANLKWSYQKRMQAGSFITCSAPCGYRLENGSLEICEEQRWIVIWIFNEYLRGTGMDDIAETLNSLHIPVAPEKLDVKWTRFRIAYILSNEKYIGDTLCQKSYTTDTFPMLQKKNHGERDQYYIHNTHPAIISRETFEAVQEFRKMKKPRNCSEGYSAPNALRKKVFCQKCGAVMKEKASRGKRYYVCYTHHENRIACDMLPVSSDQLKNAFPRLYYKLKHHGLSILRKMISELQMCRTHRMFWSKDIVSLNKKISDISSQNLMLAALKQQGLIDPDYYITENNKLTKQLREAKIEKARLLEAESDKTTTLTKALIEALEAGPDFLPTFDEELFGELVEKIIVESNICVRFRLINGLELPEQVERMIR